MVTTRDVDQLRRLNFGIRTLQQNLSPTVLEKEINRYNSDDAVEVSKRIRASAGRETAIDQITTEYTDVIREFKLTKRDQDAEARAEASYLQQLVKHLEESRNTLLNSQTFRLRNRIINTPIAGGVLRSIIRRF